MWATPNPPTSKYPADWDSQIEQEDTERIMAFDIAWDQWGNSTSGGDC
jgi:hypothetical protein